MNDRAAESGVEVWIALRRAHQGGVANLADHWLDSGRQVPSVVADALDRLTSAGLLILGDVDPKACGVRRVTVTDTGCAHYVALCQVHRPNRRAAVGTPQRWACSPHDQRSHLLTVGATVQIGALVGVCGHLMLWSVPTSAQPTGRPCPTCQALPGVPVPAPQLGNPPDSGRPPADTAPGGRPDTTAPVKSGRRVADADWGDRPQGGRGPRALGVRRGSPRADQAVGEDLATAVRPIGDQPAPR